MPPGLPLVNGECAVVEGDYCMGERRVFFFFVRVCCIRNKAGEWVNVFKGGLRDACVLDVSSGWFADQIDHFVLFFLWKYLL